MRVMASLAGVLGGACLLVGALLGLDDATADAVRVTGFVLLGVSTLLLGLLLVPKAPMWLKAVVGIGCVGLTGSVLATIYTELDNDLVDTALGAVAVVLLGGLGVRWYVGRTRRSHGNHSR